MLNFRFQNYTLCIGKSVAIQMVNLSLSFMEDQEVQAKMNIVDILTPKHFKLSKWINVDVESPRPMLNLKKIILKISLKILKL